MLGNYYLSGPAKSGIKQKAKVGFAGDKKKPECPPCPPCKAAGGSAWSAMKWPLLALGGATLAYLVFLKVKGKKS